MNALLMLSAVQCHSHLVIPARMGIMQLVQKLEMMLFSKVAFLDSPPRRSYCCMN